MALDFPANPTDGQIFNSYIWSAAKGAWQSREEQAPVAIISAVAPLAANDGDIWYNSSRGVTYVYYNDGTSSQWVEVVTSGTPELATKADLSYVNTQLALKSNISGQDFSGKIGIIGVGSQTTVGAANGGSLEVQSTSTTAASMSFHIPGVVATNVGLNKTDSNFSIGGWSFPVDSLTVDTTGRMRVPNQPSFNVTGAAAANGVSTFIYTTINHNTGNYYNSSNGRFTAPIAGTYIFEATVGNNADFYVDLSVNGNIWRRSERRNGSASIGYFWIPTVMVVKLNAGDYVSVICNYGTANSSAPYAGFSGSLIG